MIGKINLSYTSQRRAYDLVGAMSSLREPVLKVLKIEDKAAQSQAMHAIEMHTGLTSIINNGVVIKRGGKTLTFVSEDSNSYRIYEQNPLNNQIEKEISVSYRDVKSAEGFGNNPNQVETFMQEVCEMLDFPMLKLRQMFRADNFANFMKAIFSKPVLNETVNDIKRLFKEIDDNLQSITNVPTRSHVKNGYPSIKPGIRGTKQLDFAGIGRKGEDYSVNVIKDREGVEHLGIIVWDGTENGKNIIISPDGKVMKSMSVSKRCCINSGAKEYYSAAELASPEISNHLKVLRDELEKYNNYILRRNAERLEFWANHSTDGVGTIDSESETLVKEIQDKYQVYRLAMLELKEAKEKNSAKTKLGVVTRPGSPSLLLKNCGRGKWGEKEDIHITFAPISGVPSVKILVLADDENVKHTFLIRDSKLVKYKAAKLNSRGKRSDNALNYYSQEEIDNSELKKYLQIVLERLCGIENVIAQGKHWYK